MYAEVRERARYEQYEKYAVEGVLISISILIGGNLNTCIAVMFGRKAKGTA